MRGRAEVGLGRHGVLSVGEVVGDVGEQLDERDADIGHVTLAPLGHEQRHAVEHQPAEPGVVTHEVIDRRCFARCSGTVLLGLAIEGVVAGDGEAELGALVALVEAGEGTTGRPAAVVDVDDTHLVGRRISGTIEGELEALLLVFVVGRPAADRDDLDAGDPLAANDAEVARGQVLGHPGEEVDAEMDSVVTHLDLVDPIEPVGNDAIEPGVGGAHE